MLGFINIITTLFFSLILLSNQKCAFSQDGIGQMPYPKEFEPEPLDLPFEDWACPNLYDTPGKAVCCNKFQNEDMSK